MRFHSTVMALVCAAATCATAAAQDSVSKTNGLPGDAVDANAPGEQINNFVVDQTTFQSSWGKTFAVAPLIKISAQRTNAPAFLTRSANAQALSRGVRSGVPFLRSSYSVWNAPGFGINDNAARNDPGTPIATGAFTGFQFGVATAEFGDGNPSGTALASVAGGIVNFRASEPSRLFVSRVVAATNSATEACSLGSFGMGSVDSDGNVAFRVDGFGTATTPVPCDGLNKFTGSSDENIFAVDLAARSAGVVNALSDSFPAGADAAATNRLVVNQAPTHNVPNVIPKSLAGRRIVIGSNFNRDFVFESVAGGPLTSTFPGAHLAVGVTDHRGAVGYTMRNFAGLFPGSVNGTAGIVGISGGFTQALDVFGLAANGQYVSPIARTLPAVVTDPIEAWASNSVGTVQQFSQHLDQTSFQGGSAQVALGSDQAGNLLAAAEVTYGLSAVLPTGGPFNQPNRYLAVSRTDPISGTTTWSVAAWTRDTGTAIDGKTIFQNGTTPIGMLRTFVAPHVPAPGPTLSAPMIDSVGNVWFLGSYELTATAGTVLVGLFRAVYDAATFSYKLELVVTEGQTFAGRNSGRNYRLDAITLSDANSISSGTAWSGNIMEQSYMNTPVGALNTDDARTLGGIVISARILYDNDNNGQYLLSSLNPGSPDEDYNVLLFVSPGADCNQNGIPDDREIADGLVGDSNANGVPDTCEGLIGTVYCIGDGVAPHTACPCGNSSATLDNAGCSNSLAVGGTLRASGVATVGADSVALIGAQIPNGPGLYFQGTMQLASGNGVSFGDGLRCAGGTIIRLGIVQGVGNTSQYPSGVGVNSIPVSIKGLCNAGDTRHYQLWYRDSAAFCTPAVFNLTNALTLVWN